MDNKKVDIQAEQGIYTVIQHTRYETWSALSEYIDNSIQSYLDKREEIEKINPDYQLTIEIMRLYDNLIMIKDNAGGISEERMEYAFKPAAIPPDADGLNEFGLGMKSASFWLSNKWRIQTSAIGEEMSKVVSFDIGEIVSKKLTHLDVKYTISPKKDHFTNIILQELTDNGKISGHSMPYIKKHISSVYRRFINNKKPILIFIYNEREAKDKKPLKYVQPKILVAPSYKEKNNSKAEEKKWEMKVDVSIKSGQRMVVSAALLHKMSSQALNGFSIFRRNRVIQGSGDEKYRPKELMGQEGSFLYKRLFGEIDLYNFKVPYSKNDILGQDSFNALIKLAKLELEPLLRQGRNFRKEDTKTNQKKLSKQAAKEFQEKINDESVLQLFQDALDDIELEPAKITETSIDELKDIESHTNTYFNVEHQGISYNFTVINSSRGENEKLIDYSTERENQGNTNVYIMLNTSHKFISTYGHNDLKPFMNISVALVLSEIICRKSGFSEAAMVREKFNELLNTGFLGE